MVVFKCVPVYSHAVHFPNPSFQSATVYNARMELTIYSPSELQTINDIGNEIMGDDGITNKPLYIYPPKKEHCVCMSVCM